MERLIEVQQSPLIIGRTGVGKSMLMKNYLNTKDHEGKKTSVELMTFSHSSNSTKAQELIE